MGKTFSTHVGNAKMYQIIRTT